MIKVYTAGTWDLFHVGHLNIFKQSKALGDILIVGVSTDELVESYKHHKPIIPLADRLEIIRACRYVDQAVVQYKLIDIEQLKIIKPDIITIGSDWKGKDLEGFDYIRQQGGQVIYFDYTVSISSTRLRNWLDKVDL